MSLNGPEQAQSPGVTLVHPPFAYTILKKYGLTSEDYDALGEAQGWACAMCKHPWTSERRLVIDRDHATGRVRGLLCRRCNMCLGIFEEMYQTATDYLGRHRDRI